MTDRVSSEDPSIRTVRARVEHAGATSRRRVVLPPEEAGGVPDGVVRLVVDDEVYHAPVRPGADGPVVAGAYGSPRLAREPGAGDDALAAWLETAGLDAGRSVLVDVVVEGFLYGIRAPGTTTVYDAPNPPSSSLSDIAASLDE